MHRWLCSASTGQGTCSFNGDIAGPIEAQLSCPQQPTRSSPRLYRFQPRARWTAKAAARQRADQWHRLAGGSITRTLTLGIGLLLRNRDESLGMFGYCI
ncbi:MAG TPA: hypothetical protein VGD99_07585 [Anaerolineae bacterium]